MRGLLLLWRLLFLVGRDKHGVDDLRRALVGRLGLCENRPVTPSSRRRVDGVEVDGAVKF